MIPKPFEKIRLEETENSILVYATGKEYLFHKEGSFFFDSIKIFGKEILADKVRFNLTENGETISWSDQKTFIYSADDEKVVIISSGLGKTFCVNTSIEIHYDGCCFIDVKFMPIGLTVAQMYGGNFSVPGYEVQDFSLDFPLKPEYATLYHYYIDSAVKVHNFKGEVKTPVEFNASTLKESLKFPFLPIMWLGNEDVGLNMFTETDKDRRYEKDDAFEILKNENEHVLRINFLNARPEHWRDNEKRIREMYSPITFSFGIIGTPVKPYPKKQYTRKILHIDCYKKVAGDYWNFLSNPVVEGDTEIGFDRIKRLGVTTLVLHEKWNVLQNFWEMPWETERQTRKIIEECHKRGIEVIPYFGYEMSSMNPLWGKMIDKVVDIGTADGRKKGGWYRVPHQRAYVVCYDSEYGDMMYEGITKLVEKMGFDGVYLDGTNSPRPCYNEKHGCGYRDEQGNLHPTFSVKGSRKLLQRLYTYMEERGKLVNVHISSCMNGSSSGFAHLLWNGEDIQFAIRDHGLAYAPMDYFLAEYTGRNMGTPNELLCYEFEGIWTYKDSLCLAVPHGVLPRPNDIGTPLEVSSIVWGIFDEFDTSKASWHPYYKDGMSAFDNVPEKTVISYYEHEDGRKLVVVANHNEGEKNVTISSDMFKNATVYDAYDKHDVATENGKIDLTLSKFDCKFLLVK